MRRFESQLSSTRSLEDRLHICSIDIARVLARAVPQKLSKVDTSNMHSAYLTQDATFIELVGHLTQWNKQVDEYKRNNCSYIEN